MSSDSDVIRILTVDDHRLIRRGIAGLVATQSDMRVVAEATNGREALKEFRAHRPDITLMDLQMPEMSGLDAIIAIRGEYPEARIIVLTTYSGDVQALRALKAGARAYLLKDALDVELLDTIRAVHAGRKSISPEVSFQLAEHATDDALTAGEVKVLALIAEGRANKEIAKRLSISEATVKGQVQNILSKLGAKDRTHAAMIGLKRGIIQLRFVSERMSGSILLDLSPEKPVAVRCAHATLILNLRARCARDRTAAVALGVRHCAPRPGIPVAARQAAARTHGVSGVLYGSRDTAASRVFGPRSRDRWWRSCRCGTSSRPNTRGGGSCWQPSVRLSHCWDRVCGLLMPGSTGGKK